MLILQMAIGIGISMIPTNGGPVGWTLDLVLQMVGFIVAILFDAGLLLGMPRHAARRIASRRHSVLGVQPSCSE